MSVAAPPSTVEPPSGTVWRLLAPVLGSAGLFGFALMLGQPRQLLMAGLVSGALLVSGVISRIIESRSTRLRRAQVAERYRNHIAEVCTQLEEAATEQRSSAERANPSLHSLVDLVADRSRIWERRPHDTDFLTVRLGTGTVEASASARLDKATDPLSVPEPSLEADAQALVSATSHLDHMPIAVDLRGVGCLAIVGDDAARRVGAGIIAQLAVFRSPSELGVMAFVPSETEHQWDWMKWLPHVRKTRSPRDDGATLLSTDAGALEELLEDLAPDIRQTVVLVDGYQPNVGGGPVQGLETILSSGPETGVLAVVIVSHAEHLPSAASASISIEESGMLTYREMRPEGARISEITADPFDRSTGEEIARALAPLRDRSANDPAGSGHVGLMELLGHGADRLDSDRPWSDEGARLSTPIGLDQRGEPLILDIREPALGGMGPHGILIGATGSGKSELLRTLVLGLAARNSPEDLGFVLADFKGGATFAGLEALPHTAGSISNLESDPTLIDRMQEALYGELERRQRILRSVGFDRADEYRRHRRVHGRSGIDPLPALLVIVDEFGELLMARPDFAELFTSIGRTGRSLGVHLLLSSQRLDEGRIRRVEGHLRYRLCLRTFSPEESMAVIGSKAAFELPAIPGLGVLSVDSALTSFRAGLANQPFRPADRKAPVIHRFGISGPIAPEEEVSNGLEEDGTTSEMSVLVDRLRSLGTPVRPVWLDPLPDRIEFDPVPATEALTVAVGTSDLPRRQEMPRSLLDFSGPAGNLAVVGGPRSGKSTALETIITSFAAFHSPEDVAFHGIDLGGGRLHRLESLPHVGSVFGRGDREGIVRLVRQIHDLLQLRVDEVRHRRPASFEDHRSEPAASGPHVFLVVDGWGLFSREFEPELTDLVSEILATGLHHRIHVILSAGRWQDIRVAARDHIGGRFELRLIDPAESEIDRHASRRLPTDVPGRGLDAAGTPTQMMEPPVDLEPLAVRWSGVEPTPPVRMLPVVVTQHDLIGAPDGSIGIAEHEPGGWMPDLFGLDPHLIVLGDGRCGKTTALRGMIRSVVRSPTVRIGVVDYRDRLRSDVPARRCIGHATTPDEASRIAERIYDITSRRTANTVPTKDTVPTEERRDIVLIVDDYELVAGSTFNPIDSLVDLLPRGSDLGLHLVVARKVTGMTRTSFDPVFQRLREAETPTFVMDGDPAEGPVVGTLRPVRRPPGRGLYVSRSRTALVQVAHFEAAAPV